MRSRGLVASVVYDTVSSVPYAVTGDEGGGLHPDALLVDGTTDPLEADGTSDTLTQD